MADTTGNHANGRRLPAPGIAAPLRGGGPARPDNPPATATAPPVSGQTGKQRLVGVDATRGIALLGMIAVHALYDVNPDGSPTLVYQIAGGRSAATFAVLAGLGIAFMTGRKQIRGRARRGAAATLATRALVIGLLGFAFGYTDAALGAVILPYYAAMFLLAIPLVFLPTRALLAISVLIASGVPVLSHLARTYLPAPALDNPSFVELGTHPLATISELTVTGYYPALAWLAYLGTGICIGRLRLARVRTAAGLFAAGTVTACAATALSAWLMGPLGGLTHIKAHTAPQQLATTPTVADYVTVSPQGTTPTTTWWWLASDAPHTATPLDLLHTTGCATALLGGMLLLAHIAGRTTSTAAALRSPPTILLSPLTAAGAMTLTLYTAHVAYLNSGLDHLDATPGFLLQIAVALVFAIAWRRTIGTGPAEALASKAARFVKTHTDRRAFPGPDRTRKTAPRAGTSREHSP